MKRKQDNEKQKEAKKKAKERIKRFEENQKAPKKKKDESEESNMACVEYWEKNVINGDDDWHLRVFYYNKEDKKEKFNI